MEKHLLKSLLVGFLTLMATGAWAAVGDVKTNADIDFSNAIADGVVTGTVNQIAIGTGGAETIIQDGWLRLGDHANTVTIAEDERAGARDAVTINFKMAFGNKNGMGSGFRVKDADGNEIATYQHARWNGNPGNTLGIDMSGLMGGHNGNKAVAANATSYEIVFDYAKKQIVSTLTYGSTTKTFTAELANANPIATFEVYGYGAGGNADRASIFDDLVITTTEGNYNVQSATYAVNFVYNDAIIETIERTGDVGDEISLLASDMEPRTIDGQKYFYEYDNSDGKIVEADGSTVVTVFMRQAETWNYTFNAVLDGDFLKAIGEGTVVEGETASVTWPRYVLYGTNLAYRDAVSNSYSTTFTPTANGAVQELAYQEFANAENVIFFAEAEDIATLEPITDAYLPNRFSAGRGAYAKEDGSVITRVEQGKKYKLTARLMGTQSVATFKFSIGARVIWEHATSSTSFYPGTDSYTEEFVAAKNADITLGAAGGVVVSGRVTNAVDYIYLEEIGLATEEELEAAAAADQAAEEAATLAAAKAELQEAITAAQAIETTDKVGVDELAAAIAAAETALAAEDATVESLAAAKAALEQAVADFEAANAALAAAKAELQEAITAAEAIDTTDKVGVEELAAAIAAAKEALNDAEATVESLNAAKAALAEAVAAFEAANTVVEVTYIVNAEFNPEADPIGWDAVASDQYRDYGMYQIGGEQMVRFAAPTVDETHLATEFAAGVEARWATNFAAYTQTTAELPAGAYALTFDVENVNGGTTAAAYENRFTVTVGETVYTDESTEWMDGKSAWTTHAIKFILTEAAPISISLGYGTGSNNFGANNTPALYVSHLALEEIDAIEVSLSALESAIASAQAKAATYTVGDELFLYPESEIAPLKEAIATAQAAYDAKESIDAVVAATEALNAFVANFAPAINAPKQGQGYYIANTTATGNLNIVTEKVSVAADAITFITAVEGGYVLSNANGEYIFKTDNDWTLSTTSEIAQAYVVNFNKVEGGYTIQGAKGLFGLDNTEEGSTVYANKAQSNNGVWTITEVAEDEALIAAREALTAEIEAAKALKTEDRTEGIEDFDAAIEAAEAALTATTAEEVNAALAALKAAEKAFLDINALVVAKAALSEKIAEAEALTGENGMEVLAAAIETAKAALNAEDATLESVQNATTALQEAINAFKVANMEFQYQKYIIANVASKKYWSVGNDWGTRASLVAHPEYVKLIPQADGTYFMESQANNGGTSYYFNGDYMDNGSPVALTITEVGDGVYTIANGENYYGWDGTSTVLGKNLAADSENALWTIVSLDAAKAALAEATATEPMDATMLIEDHDFGRNNRYSNKWTEQTGIGNMSGGNNTNNCAESYHAVFTLSQQLADAPAGIYAMTAQGFYRQDDGATEDAPVFYANEETATFPEKTGSENSMSDASVSFSAGKYTIEPIFVQVTEAGQLTIGAKGTAEHQWVIWDNFVLTYYGANATIDEVKNAAILAELNQLREKAADLKEQVEIEVVKTAIDEALAATADVTGAEAINAAIATMKAVVEQAEASVIAKNVLPKMKQFTEATNLYTAEAFDTYYTQWNTKYTEGTLTKEEADALQDPNVVTGWHAANNVDDLLMSAWDAAPEAWDTYHVNTWSTEGGTDGSDFQVPFIEYWTGDGESLAEKTLTATMTGLEAGDYEVSAWVRVRVKNDNTDSANGITLQVGEGEAISATTGEQVGESQFYLATVTAEGTVAEDGQLTVKFNVAADNNISWLAFKNVTYTKKAVEPQPVEGLIYSWEGAADGATEEGGEIAGGGDEDRINYSQAGFYTICLRGKADYSTQYVTITLDEGSTINAGDEIAITAFRNKNETGKKAGAKMQFDNDASVTTGDGTEFVNLNAAVETSDEYGTEPNTVTVTVPEGVVGSKTIKITRSQTGTNLFITKLQVTKKKTPVGIEEVKDRQAIEAIYNLSGQKIEKTTKGLYIINGKKVVVK